MWRGTNLYCPGCGKRDVRVDDSGEDFYHGPTYVCMWCQHTFTVQGPDKCDETTLKKIKVELNIK